MTTEVDSSSKRTSRLLVVLLCGLVVVIVGLVIGISLVKKSQTEMRDADSDTPGVQALEIQEYIEEKYENDSNYSVQDAIDDFEIGMSSGSDEKKVYVAISYADFIYSQYEDIEKAIAIMERVEPLLGDGMARVDYYIALEKLYEKSGNKELADEYARNIVNVIPEVSPEKRIITYEDGEEGQ